MNRLERWREGASVKRERLPLNRQLCLVDSWSELKQRISSGLLQIPVCSWPSSRPMSRRIDWLSSLLPPWSIDRGLLKVSWQASAKQALLRGVCPREESRWWGGRRGVKG